MAQGMIDTQSCNTPGLTCGFAHQSCTRDTRPAAAVEGNRPIETTELSHNQFVLLAPSDI